MKVEVLNTNAVLPSKVYWIATAIQIAGEYNGSVGVCFGLFQRGTICVMILDFIMDLSSRCIFFSYSLPI